MFYALLFILLACGVGYAKYLETKQKNEKNEGNSKVDRPLEFILFQRSYLTVYLLAMFADWLKGPYVYALYDSYGYNAADIATLFLSGFLASGITGPFVGSYADKYGRQKNVQSIFSNLHCKCCYKTNQQLCNFNARAYIKWVCNVAFI